MIAKHDGTCLDRCGLRIRAGHDAIEPGHHGWRHVNCERSRLEAWVRERMNAGAACADVQLALARSGEPAGLILDASRYALDYADQLASEA